MSAANSFRSYGSVAKSLHWLTVLLIFTAFPLGWIGNQMAYAITASGSAATDTEVARTALIFSIHKTLGITVFFVAVVRILWALTQTKPGLLNADKPLEAWAAETVHWMLYGALVMVPLSGWIHHAAASGFAPIWWPFGQNLPFVPKDAGVAKLFGNLHDVFTKVLLLAVLLHIGGALKHHVIDRDATLRRMLPGAAPDATPPQQTHSKAPAMTALVAWGAAIAFGVTAWAMQDGGAKPAEALQEVASDWSVDSGALTISIAQLGSEVTGEFADWTAAIQYDAPAEPGPAGHVIVTVSIPSLSLGSVTDQAMGPDFFDAESFPTAVFDADLIKTEDGHTADGTLTIKGTTLPVSIPFTLALDGDTATAAGGIQLMRLDYGVGATMSDESSLGFAVDVAFDLTATR